jgi:hypothetical protein
VTSFYLVDGGGMPRWCTLDFSEGDGFWVDFKARKTPRDKGRPRAVVECAHDAEILSLASPVIAKLERDCAMEFLLDPGSDQGWIAPDGRFYGCNYYAHDDLAFSLIRKTPQSLEILGWVRVHADSFGFGACGANGELTQRQLETLFELGFPDPTIGSLMPRDPSLRRQPSMAVRSRSGPRDPRRQPDPPKGAVKAGLDRLVTRLSSDDQLARLTDGEFLTDFGGCWTWMVHGDKVEFGSEHAVGEIADAEGLLLYATAFDQIEAVPCSGSGIRRSPDAVAVLERFAVAPSP